MQGRHKIPDLLERIKWVVSHGPNYRRARASKAVPFVLVAGNDETRVAEKNDGAA